MRLTRAAFASLALVLVASSAHALNQTNGGPQIPTTGSLQQLFTMRGENIDALKDALTVPETFVPSCGLTFNVLQRNAGNKNSFGWYNVTGSKPTVADLHEFLSCADPVGTVKTLNIKNDPGYKGGEIGFYEAAGPCASLQNYDAIFFSQKEFNNDCNLPEPYIHLLIYNSTVTDKAFYFAWEDLECGGDNDFDDLTTFVTGISCSGGGGKCQTGKPGVCADGTMQCQVGKLTCLPLVGPSKETCDGFDNDCNGQVDDGDICPMGQVCDNGNCVPKCGGGEFQCDPSLACDPQKGLCVDPACVNVACPAGTKCISGICKDPCDGVKCPAGQACIAGNCVDPCQAIKCDDNQVCKAGACIDKCQCAGCAASDTCQPTGLCIPTACQNKNCPAGQVCADDGTCQDACKDVVCPAGQACKLGQCVADMGGTGGSGGSGGNGGGGAGGSFEVGGGGSDSSSSSGTGAAGAGGVASGGAPSGGTGGSSGSKGSCGCRNAGSDASGWGALAMIGAAIAAARRRRRS
jgi:MYXO-CTERM domain-containing protein